MTKADMAIFEERKVCLPYALAFDALTEKPVAPFEGE
jgi:hypothetical protein